MGQSYTHYLKATAALLVCASVTVSFGQACGPAFLISNESTSAAGLLSVEEKKACAPTTTPPAVQSISTLVAFINTLPRPVQLHCVIANLPRPIYVVGNLSTSSAQPSPSSLEPRIFIKSGQTFLTIVSSGVAVNTLEISQSAGLSLFERADFRFPISEAAISERAGLDHILLGGGTSCGLCHQGEVLSRTLDGSPVYKSQLMLPASSQDVSISTMQAEATSCKSKNDQSDRCLLFRSLFDGGNVLPFSF